MMLWSEASLSPSVSLASTSAVAFLSLDVNFAPGARLVSPAGTIIGGRGLSDGGSTNELSTMSLGVPLNPGAGNLISNGIIPDADALSAPVLPDSGVCGESPPRQALEKLNVRHSGNAVASPRPKRQ